MGRVAVVTVDNPPVNALSTAVRQGLLDSFRQLAGANDVDAIVLTGAGRDFIAGADLREMTIPVIDPSLPAALAAMESCPQPIVAAIGGSALGGGYEVALACDLRIATPDAVVGLPETKLGIMPGAGGTQRLPRLTGVAKAIELIADGRRMKAKDAAALGMIDKLIEGALLAEAIRIAPTTAKRRLSEEKVKTPDPAEVDAAASAALKRAKGAKRIDVAIQMIKNAATLPFEKSVAIEREEFLRLRESDEAKALVHLFFAEREVRKVPGLGAQKPHDIKRVTVIGAGTMGAGIAVAFADAGIPVSVIERDASAAAAGTERVRAIYKRQVESKRIAADKADERFARISVADDWSTVGAADLVIEAVFEDMNVKADAFRKIDSLASPDALLATNTSYLDVDAIAAATRRPERVLGLHFFSPAHVMRLLEVVRGKATAPDALATALEAARKIGKLPVVAGVCDGFIGNRIFAMYRRHAEYLAVDGAPFEAIDRAVENYGFAMGPFAVSDLAGLDIAWVMRKRRAAKRDPNERYVEVADRLCEQGRLGRKTGRGWYLYPEGGKRVPDPEVSALFEAERVAKGIVARNFSEDEIVRRLLSVMANEGAKVLADGIALRASDIDLVFVNGYGFPAERGGPMFAADLRGLRDVLKDAEVAAQGGGAGSEPAPLLVELAARGSSFAEWTAGRKASSQR
ncbi:MAG: 3-hydroxyacyl-CoA dehydrogenase NAD-binding domain-containing protein [Xanthobacteraceae bacterium]